MAKKNTAARQQAEVATGTAVVAAKAAGRKAADRPRPRAAKPGVGARCRWGEGRYLSPATAKPCSALKENERKALCDEHDAEYRKLARDRKPEPSVGKAKAPRSAGSSAESTPRAKAKAPKSVAATGPKSRPPAPAREAHPRVPESMAALAAPTTVKRGVDTERVR
jgi:hypothetical protein